MKLSKISLALLATCGALASTPSFALLASAYTNTGEAAGNAINIRISGASAQDNGILGSALQYCTAGSLHRYAISNNFVYFCSPDFGTGTGQIPAAAGKTQLAIYKYSAGGSGAGVQELNDNALLPFLDLTKLATAGTICAAPVTASFGYTTTVGTSVATIATTYNNVVCNTGTAFVTSVTTNANTYIGLSDVEPAFFDQTGAGFSNLDTSSLTALIFGVPVTRNIRDALQTQQGLTAGSDTEANMPSLTRSQVTSIFTQAGGLINQTWAKIGVTATLSDPKIYVARRVDSSGTQKTFEALIAGTQNGYGFGKSCSIATEPFVTPDSGTTTGDAAADCNLAASSAPIIFAGSGGGDVRTCLINHHAQNRGAVGMLTTEDKAGTNNWRFVKVDGVTPSQANVAAGRYQFYTDTALNTRTNVNPTASAFYYSTFLTRFTSDLGTTAIINAINGGSQSWGGAAGLMTKFVSGTPDFTGATPVNPWNRLVGNSTLDNCQQPKAPQ